MAEGVVSFAVERIGDLLIQKVNLLHIVEAEVGEMKEELEMMGCYLKDADAKQDKHETIRLLVGRIRDLAYDVENVIETFAVKVALKKRQRIQNTLRRSLCFCNEVKVRYNISSDIQSHKSKINRFKTELQTYGVVAISERDGSGSSLQRRGPLRRTYSHIIEEDFVGFEKDVKKLVAEVVSEAKRCRVISICGMGGSGKTTVARKIYHHQDVRCHFDAFAWASISQQWDPKDVLQRILDSLHPHKRDEFGNMTFERLVKYLNEFLQEKKCLIVLDDIWSSKAWDDLSPAFHGVKLSKILITTRNKDLAADMDQSCFLTFIHELPCLSKEQSWELLQKKALVTTEDAGFRIDTEMEDLGKEMAEQCSGLPLAIVVLGGILASKHTLGQWQEVRRNVSSYLKKGKGHGGQYRNVNEVLALSYQDLPYRLKACFLYLGSFPEDFSIQVDKLYQFWMAEGFIPAYSEGGGNGEETMMDVAETYLGELAQRCMVQVELESKKHRIAGTTGRYTSCQIHDLLRELCLSKMEEENFLKVIDNRKYRCTHSLSPMQVSTMKGSNSISYRTRRLAFYSDNDTYNDAFDYLLEQGVQDFRSILFFHGQFSSILEAKFTHFAKKFELLRLLDLQDFKFGEDGQEGLPKEIGNMVLLSYLGLRDSSLKKLPSSIGNLRFLQTLDLRIMPINVPDVLWKIEGLMHLYLPVFYFGRLRIDGLKNLETLEGFQTTCSDPNDLFSLTKLRRLNNLGICESLDHLDAINNYLKIACSRQLQYTSINIVNCDLGSEKGLSLLTELLRCDCLGALSIWGNVGKLPEYDPHCYQNLTRLSLKDSSLEEDSMATLEKLPNLTDLSLHGNVFKSKCMVCSTNGFPHLSHLSLDEMTLEEWNVDEGAMPNLSIIYINKCYSLKMLPEGLRFVSALERLYIENMPEAFKDRLRAVDGIEGKDVNKVAHIADVYFYD